MTPAIFECLVVRMKLGLVTDIHEQVDTLRTAIDCFQKNAVDQVVVIGDLFLDGQRLEETCALLSSVGTIGVWGNHDFGLSHDPSQEIKDSFPSEALGFLSGLKPRLELDGCFFAHVEPWLDPEVLSDLWYFEGPPDSPEKVARIFAAVPHRVIFAGHFHRWLLVTPEGIQKWSGQEPIYLSDGRYHVVIGAVCEGHFAIYDTRSTELTPFNAE